MKNITKMGKKRVFGLGSLNLVQNGVRDIAKMEKNGLWTGWDEDGKKVFGGTS